MEPEAVRNALRQYITSEILNSPQFALSDDEPLVTSGLIGSFALVDIALWVERSYGVPISDRDLLDQKFNSVSDFVNYVIKKGTRADG
jgi:acyl carrier protein